MELFASRPVLRDPIRLIRTVDQVRLSEVNPLEMGFEVVVRECSDLGCGALHVAKLESHIVANCRSTSPGS
jgi:hypothetical protein